MHLKKYVLSKYVIRESRAICAYQLRHSLDMSLLKKWSVFLQNASGNPNVTRAPIAGFFQPDLQCVQ